MTELDDLIDPEKPVVVAPNAGAIDMLAALARYVTVLFTLGAALLAVLQTKDIAAIITFLRGNDGAALISAAVGLGTLIYGLIKTHRRGAEIAAVAGDYRVPNSVAQLKR